MFDEKHRAARSEPGTPVLLVPVTTLLSGRLLATIRKIVVESAVEVIVGLCSPRSDRHLNANNNVHLVNRDKTLFEASGSTDVAYWFKDRSAFEVDNKHIGFILDHPDQFGFEDRDALALIFQKHNKKNGVGRKGS